METPVAIEREAVIPNKEGLHFRPIMQFVDLASRYAANVSVQCEARNADACSPMELLMLMATQGTKVKVVAEGEDAAAAADALIELIEAGFNET